MQRRTFLSGLAPAALHAQWPSSRRPNFLFLIGDDHAAYAMGCAGDPNARTPTLDALAQDGVRFASHYCNSPVCTPSRQSLLTGLMPHAAGVTVLQTALDSTKPTLAKQLQAAGYTTAVFGKMHWNQPFKPGLHGFDLAFTEQEANRAFQQALKGKPAPAGVQTKPLPWRPFQTPARQWLNAGCLPYPAQDEDMRGTLVARRAMDYIAQAHDRPFALWVSLQEPHSPFDFPVEDAGKFSPSSFTAPRVGPEDAGQIPLIFRDLDDASKRGIAAAYYTSAHFMDRNFGRVINQLRQSGEYDNTVIVYIGDNGYCLGHHGRFEKHCGYEQAIRIPLVIRAPGITKPRVINDLTENIDLSATILDLLDARPIPGQQGHSLVPYLHGRKPARPRQHIVCEYLENEEVYVRTRRWKLIFCSGRRERTDGYKTDNPKPGRNIRLFDVQADPGEFVNVAQRNPKVVAELIQFALERFRQTHPDAAKEPPGLAPSEALEFYLPPRDARG